MLNCRRGKVAKPLESRHSSPSAVYSSNMAAGPGGNRDGVKYCHFSLCSQIADGLNATVVALWWEVLSLWLRQVCLALCPVIPGRVASLLHPFVFQQMELWKGHGGWRHSGSARGSWQRWLAEGMKKRSDNNINKNVQSSYLKRERGITGIAAVICVSQIFRLDMPACCRF